jgi:RNA polymerase sigma-70 factor (ECF subfamily)
LDERLIAAENQPDDEVEERFLHKRLRAALRRLTPGQQEVLALRFGERLTAREAAEVMEKSTNAVEVQQHRALNSLRRILEIDE